MKVTWSIDNSVANLAIDDLDKLLDRLHDEAAQKGAPLMVEVQHENGRLLVVGLGLDESVISFFEEGMRPSYTSTGNAEREGSITFEYAGEPSDFLSAMAIPIATAREAVRRFALDGNRPENVLWDKDWT